VPGDLRIKLDTVIAMPASVGKPYYSRQDSNVVRWTPITKVETKLRRAGDSVALVTSSWDKQAWSCSGIAIRDDMLLTNWHCGGIKEKILPEAFWNRQVCANFIADFSWDGDVTSREYACRSVWSVDRDLDLALIEIRPLRHMDSVRPVKIRNGNSAAVGESLRLVHHPASDTKQMSDVCKVEPAAPSLGAVEADFFSHRCDSEAGSSGGALLDDKLELVGVHRLGFNETATGCDKLNTAIDAAAVRRFLSNAGVDVP
jgi:V8-like Glu-specific endopeptidase